MADENPPLYCLQDTGLDPYFNVALEEYLLKHRTENFFRLWRNDNAIVVGKNQNAIGEINVDYVAKKGIHVVRRYSGGGTVYHDLGNVNYTFVTTVAPGESKIDFHRYGQPIIDVLASYGITARFDDRNSIRIGDLKISGNAEAIHRNRVLHHGCILFDSTLDVLNNAILVDESKFNSRATQSVRATVTNIKNHTDKIPSVDAFIGTVMDFIKQQNPNAKDYELTAQDRKTTHHMAEKTYKTWDWIYGRSPAYDVTTTWHNVTITISVKKGLIKTTETTPETPELKEKLTGQKHQKQSLINRGLPVDLVDRLF